MPNRGPTKNKVTEQMLAAFAKRLIQARIEAGIDAQEDMARRIGIPGPQYRRYEYGAAWPQIDVIYNMCQVLDATSDWLLFGRGPKSVERSRAGRRPKVNPDAGGEAVSKK